MNHNSLKSTFTAFILAVLLSVTSGVSALSVENISEDATTIRFVHAAPYAGVVDVWNEKGIVAKNFAYGLVSGYLKVTDGLNETIYLAVAGTDDIVAELSLSDIKGSGSYTAFVHNVGEGVGKTYGLAAAIIENPEFTSETDTTYVNALHAAANVGDVQFTVGTDGLSSSNGWIQLSQADYSGFVALETPTKVLIDADFDYIADITFSIPKLPSNDFVHAIVVSDGYGVYLFGLLSDNTLVKIKPDAVEPDPEMSYVRIVHLASNAKEVDVYLNGETKAVSDLSFGEAVGYVELASDTYRVDITPAGADVKKSVLSAILDLEPGVSYTVVAYPERGGIRLQVTGDKRGFQAEDAAGIRASHLIYSVGKVDVYVVNNSDKEIADFLLIDNLAFGDPQGYLEVPAIKYIIGLDVDQDGRRDLTYILPELMKGDIADLYAATDNSGNPVIYTLLETGEFFFSNAIELQGITQLQSEIGSEKKQGSVIFQETPEVIINPPGDRFQPWVIMQ